MLLAALAARRPTAWGRLPTHGALVEHLPKSGPRWLVAEGRYRGDELLAAADRLRPEQRLVLPVERRLDDEILPQRLLDSPVMLLRPAEIEEMFTGVGGALIDQLARLSDGWIGPLAWLHGRWRGGQSPEAVMAEAVLATDDFISRFDQLVLSRLDREILDALVECSVDEELDAALWRRLWVARPERLAALERLLWEWGLLITDAGAKPRLPRLVRRATRGRRPPPARRREIFRQLGLAAHALGLAAEAERYLSRAGDAARLNRLRAIGESTTGAPAVPPPGVGPGVASRCSPTFPRFELHLLGHAMVRRIDASGRQRELEWRLRRALQSVAFLALAGDRRATKQQLVDAIWHDAGAAMVAKNFHPTMSEARRTVHREVFVYSQGSYILNPELGWWSDCDRFRQLIERGRRLATGSLGAQERCLDAWHAAWRLYRGELLSGVEADWVRGRRQAFHHDYIELLRDVGGLCARLGRVTQALDAYRSLLLAEPFEERVHLRVMELYARQGRRDLVRRQFVRLHELLAQELNVEPAEEIQQRYHRLMR